MMIQVWRVIKAGTQNFMRNLWLSTAATIVMTVTLSLIIISFISNSALTTTIKGVTDKIDVSVYLRNDLTDAQISSFRQALHDDPNVDTIVFKSKLDALADYRRQHAGDPQLLNAINEQDNPLPASLQVKTVDPNKMDSISSIVNRPEFKAMLDPTAPPSYTGDRKTTIDRIVSFSNFFQLAGIVVSVIFLIISILIIFNTIRMAIFTRRAEIEIMKLVGATKWYIRGPFLFEAVLYGIIGALIAAGLTYSLLLWGGPRIINYIDMRPILETFQAYPIPIIIGEMLIGIAIGVFSSLLAMGRHLKL